MALRPPPYSNEPAVPIFESRSDLVIAIDFGTTFTGIAYGIADPAKSHSANSDDPNVDFISIAKTIKVITQWPNPTQGYHEKTPTTIAYNKSPPLWGGDVETHDHPQVSYFKLGLQPNLRKQYPTSSRGHSLFSAYLIDHTWTHQDLPSKKAVDYAADFLTQVHEFCMNEYMPTKFSDEFLKTQKISYVITVPAMWTDRAKELTRQAAQRAGIERRKLMLIAEPEAAAIHCATMCQEATLRDNDRFLVCDAGGGTVVFSKAGRTDFCRT